MTTVKDAPPSVVLFDEAFDRVSNEREKLREMLGGKGAGLAEMCRAGVSVPPGMTISTEMCRQYYAHNGTLPPTLMQEVMEKVKVLEERVGRRLGDEAKPLLLSVRSGSKFSMPGMMDTILNLGLNDKTVGALGKLWNNERFAWDSYRRFIQMYSAVVLEIPRERFEHLLESARRKHQVENDNELPVPALMSLVSSFKEMVKATSGKVVPADPAEQLKGAVEAVFRSWKNPRAILYRNLHHIDHNLGTAVTVQAMVFGNLDEQSGTGVCFTRDPGTGEKLLFGEYLINAQGEDVVAGIRTPEKISSLKSENAALYGQLEKTAQLLEEFYKDVQDIEFTIEQGKLYLLQTRTGKRSAQAAVKIAVDLANEGVISREEALKRIAPEQINQLLLPSFDPAEKEKAEKESRYLGKGLNASPGAAIGMVSFSPHEAEKLSEKGHKVILVRPETCPDDLHGIVAAKGVLTSRGGMTSHAAVVARGMGKPCVTGCSSLLIDLEAEEATLGTHVIRKGDVISLDGSTGEIFWGAMAMKAPEFTGELTTLLEWADSFRALGIRANADTPQDARRAREFGAEGIGLCRTEHMFMDQERLPIMQSMIMAASKEDREVALVQLRAMQKEDFRAIFEAMDGYPVTIRLLDPPLHEFLPSLEELLESVATRRAKGLEGQRLFREEKLLKRVRELKESNPMMGLRGCRLGLLFPEINEMQVTAIFEAAVEARRQGIEVKPEIMIPLVGHERELQAVQQHLEKVALSVMEREGMNVEYLFGTMIEVPRACLVADKIAETATFFSFGTNDLTQMTFGYSRDDAEGKFLQRYLDGVEIDGEKHKILQDNPFEILDRDGVGQLMQIAVQKGRVVKPSLKVGVCGEHGGESSSIHFAHKIGLDYVSSSPFRVPLARLSAAQAALK